MLLALLLVVVAGPAQLAQTTPVAAATTYAADSFGRTVASAWGAAESGGSWWLSGPSSSFSVANGRGQMSASTAGAMRSALLTTARARDVDITTRVSTDKTATGHGQFVYLVARRDSSGNEYRLGARFAGSNVYLQVVRMSGATATRVGSEVPATNVSFAPGATLRLRAQASGADPTTLRMKAWADTAQEPSAWTYSVTDSTAALQLAGGLGLRSYLSSSVSNAPVSFSYDDFRVTDPAETAPAPPPPVTPPAGSYVSTTGSDSNDGTYARPWRTLQRAANIATGVVNIRGGTYAGFLLKRSGLTFVSYPGETVTVSGGTNVIFIDGVSSATLRNLVIRGAVGPRGSGVLVGSSSNVRIEGSTIRDNRSYGVRTWHSTYVTIKGNEITKNDEGVRLSYRATGNQVLDNRIYHNDRMIDDSSPDQGGGIGVVFLQSTGAVLAKGNQVWGNRAPDRTYGYDGGAFEIFGASDVTITENVMWDNKHVMETGTAGGYECRNNKFTRNVAYAASTKPGYAHGLLFTCMSDSVVANNTMRGFDQAAVNIVNQASYKYGGSIERLTLRNNILVSDGPAIYYLHDVPSSVSVDRNLIWNRGGTSMAYVVGSGSIHGFSNLQSRTGLDRNGFNADPRFVDLGGHDYRLQTTSPAIDRGWSVYGVTEGYLGAAPDIGRYETR